MSVALLCFALGVMTFHVLPAEVALELAHRAVELSALLFALGSAALLTALCWHPPRRGLALGALVLGLSWAALDAGRLLAGEFPESLARVPLVVEGQIRSLPLERGPARRFLFEVERAWREGEREPLLWHGRVRLSWYGSNSRPLPDLSVGERWRLPVRLKPRHGFANPGGFDYERWLVTQGIQATGSLRSSRDATSPERLDSDAGQLWIERIRQHLADHLAGVLGEHRALGLIQGLTLGERSAIISADWEALRRTGTGHLLAISGLHVALISGAIWFLVSWLWSRSMRLSLLLAAPRAGALVALGAALAYAALAGFSLSTQRALVMLAVVLGARLWLRALRPWHALLLALGVVLLIEPRAPLATGFWLSFGAVTALLAGLGQRLNSHDLWSHWGRAQWIVALGLVVPMLWLFGHVSLIAPLINLIAVPLFSLVLLPLVLLATLASLVPGLEQALLWVADLLGWTLDGLGWLGAQPWAMHTLPAPPLWVWASALVASVLLLAPRALPGRWLALVLIAPLVLVQPAKPPPGALWFTLLDVGQGLSAVARTAEGTLVFDTGPGFASGFNTGSAVLLPFLRHQGVERIDRLVISHADRDHAGGLEAVLAEMPVARVLSGEPDALALARAEPCQAGEGWNWSGVSFTFLHPPPGAALDGNAASCVLRIAVGEHSLLLTGDVGRRTELALLERMGAALASTILIAGHHGSATSSAARFLDAVAPEWVLFSAGYANQYGFPAAVVRERVVQRGIAIRESAREGAIELRLSAQGVLSGPRSWRVRHRRWWTHRIEADG